MSMEAKAKIQGLQTRQELNTLWKREQKQKHLKYFKTAKNLKIINKTQKEATCARSEAEKNKQ